MSPPPNRSPLFDYLNDIWRGVQFAKLLIVQFSPSRSSFLGPDILISTLIGHLSLRSFFDMADMCSQAHFLCSQGTCL